MRIRLAHATIKREVGLAPLFTTLKTRNVAVVTGEGHLYTAMQREANRAGYDVWSIPSEDDEFEGIWGAVRSDLITETQGVDLEAKYLVVGTNVEGLGDITPIGEPTIVDPDRMTLISQKGPYETDNYTVLETLFRVDPLDA